MKLTWTFYPKYEKAITLVVNYVPQLDKTGDWGFLHVELNHAWVSWDCFRSFDKGDVKSKKEAFERLVRLDPDQSISDKILLS
ncbi:hypothetical protein [Dyadobacter sp. CY312]|uniref:hypothetical protein n=1 Tax=Dyadobacter sp. CY312 TaxID=2907303 RepID=UPI001F2296AA|nr:hypothetical protein [Dyadobacter sp. CY312]MCE7038831.1 hypothetical protein [Dyadobacter sp. CY312]